MILLFKGIQLSEYRGMDGDKLMHVTRGEKASVSDTKGKQLLSDFPKDWDILDGGDAIILPDAQAPAAVAPKSSKKGRPAKKAAKG